MVMVSIVMNDVLVLIKVFMPGSLFYQMQCQYICDYQMAPQRSLCAQVGDHQVLLLKKICAHLYQFTTFTGEDMCRVSHINNARGND
jgi:hypothetical protein